MGCCEHKQPCRPKCMRRCVGEIVKKYRVYQTCCYDVVAVCSWCGHECEHGRHHMCPRCGAPVGEFAGFGGGFGRMGRFGFSAGRRYAPGEEEEEVY